MSTPSPANAPVFAGRPDAAKQIVLAKAYLTGSDSGVAQRTWQMALDALILTKCGSTHLRWQRAAADSALDPIRSVLLIETRAE